MGFPPFFSLKNQLLAISVSLIIVIMLSFSGYYSYSVSSTLLFFVLPTSLPFIFSKIKHIFVPTGSLEEPFLESESGLKFPPEEKKTEEENQAAQEEGGEIHYDKIVLSGECPSLEGSNSNENLANLCGSLLEKCECSVSEDELSAEIAVSEDSESDDESLIEITLEDEPTAVFQQELKGGFHPDFVPEFSPELLFRKHGLMELLSEINEEDNMIEIDITMGSIKCSRFDIKA